VAEALELAIAALVAADTLDADESEVGAGLKADALGRVRRAMKAFNPALDLAPNEYARKEKLVAMIIAFDKVSRGARWTRGGSARDAFRRIVDARVGHVPIDNFKGKNADALIDAALEAMRRRGKDRLPALHELGLAMRCAPEDQESFRTTFARLKKEAITRPKREL
jgi:hypothetical protein